MGKNSSIVKVVVAVLLGALVFISYLWIKNNNPYDWRITYLQDSKEPYGCYIFTELLKAKVGDSNFINVKKDFTQIAKNNKDSNATYFFIDNWVIEDSAYIASLLDFAERGNDVVIASENIPYSLTEKLGVDSSIAFTDYTYYNEDEIILNFYDSNLAKPYTYKCGYYYKNKIQSKEWKIIDGYNFSDSLNGFIQLGFIGDGYVNFCVYYYGEGRIFLHTNPLIFTNYSLLNKKNVEYVDKVFSYVGANKIYYDKFKITNNNDNTNNLGKSPLAFVLNNKQLRWAWFILVALGILYMIFFGKRKQSAIPILLEKKNNTVDYIQTIGALFLKVGDNQKVAIYKMRYFLNYIKLKYHIASTDNSQNFIEKIAIKSGVNYDDVSEIFEQYKLIEIRKGLTKSELNDFHNALNKFYKNCK